MRKSALLLFLIAGGLFAAEKPGLPTAGIPGLGTGFCVGVKGVPHAICTPLSTADIDPEYFKTVVRNGVIIVGELALSPIIGVASRSCIFPELGDAPDPKAVCSCVCAGDSQVTEITGQSSLPRTNSGKGSCTYWEVCNIKGVPADKDQVPPMEPPGP